MVEYLSSLDEVTTLVILFFVIYGCMVLFLFTLIGIQIWLAIDIKKDNEIKKYNISRRSPTASERAAINAYLDIGEMREATAEERESINKYIDSISIDTGVNIFDLMKENKE